MAKDGAKGDDDFKAQIRREVQEELKTAHEDQIQKLEESQQKFEELQQKLEESQQKLEAKYADRIKELQQKIDQMQVVNDESQQREFDRNMFGSTVTRTHNYISASNVGECHIGDDMYIQGVRSSVDMGKPLSDRVVNARSRVHSISTYSFHTTASKIMWKLLYYLFGYLNMLYLFNFGHHL